MQDFETKRKNLFACLDAIADQSLTGTILDQSEYEKRSLDSRKRIKKANPEDLSTSKLRGKESLFKKPDLPIAKCLKSRITPDYKINPHKWTKYSLEDTDISDQMNSRAAFDFLKNIESKKQEQAENSDDEILTSKIVFNKSSCRDKGIVENSMEDKAIRAIGSKLVMPEYVVGKKQKIEKKRRINRNDTKNKANKLTLSHLLDFEEVDDNI